VPAGAVLSQSPATGTLFIGDPITVVVSKGPQFVAVPDVFSKKVGDAKARLEGLGFTVKIDKVLGGLLGFVQSQSIPAGTLAPNGSTITLVVV
jgi:serine/threonine-protein kinase